MRLFLLPRMASLEMDFSSSVVTPAKAGVQDNTWIPAGACPRESGGWNDVPFRKRISRGALNVSLRFCQVLSCKFNRHGFALCGAMAKLAMKVV